MKTRRNRRLRKNKTRKNINGGGITSIREKEESFMHFIRNSDIDFFKHGANGITLLLTLKPGIESPYISTDISTFGQPVKKLIMKILFLSQSENGFIEFSNISSGYLYRISYQHPTQFLSEVNIQKSIYFQTMDYLDPVCPAIVFSELFLYDRFMDLFTSLEIDDIDLQHVIDTLNYLVTVDFGIIAMEYADHTVSLYELSPNRSLSSSYGMYVNMSLYLILETALKTGYSHADFHTGNIMINRSVSNYFQGILGKPILIDFGLSVKIPVHVLQDLHRLCEEHNYTDALKLICSVQRNDGEYVHSFPDFYGWLCGTVSPFSSSKDINKEINQQLSVKVQELLADPVFLRRYENLNAARKTSLMNSYMISLRDEIIQQISSRDLFIKNTNNRIRELFEKRELAIDNIRAEELPFDLPLNSLTKRRLIDEYYRISEPETASESG